jgi:hypothetical protein
MGDLPSNHTSDVRQHWVRDLAPVTGLVKVWKRLFAEGIHCYPKLLILGVPDDSSSSTGIDHTL